MTDIEYIIKLMYQGEDLKTLERSGWIIAGISSTRNESVAEHSYGCILSSILISQHLLEVGHNIDFEKIVIMAALHDIQESKTGDIPRTPENEQNPEFIRRKEESEKEAAKEILNHFENSFNRFIRIWNEYSEGISLESRVVRGADMLDMILHARKLELFGNDPEKLDQFYQSGKTIIDSLNIMVITQIFDILFQEHREAMLTCNREIE
ncbi:HD domain-containing protein [Candidatus Thorarchaeota archaeon]|nr:MAG: HD domain-containing protein [Candidatus Thorarchaeota archaeon]